MRRWITLFLLSGFIFPTAQATPPPRSLEASLEQAGDNRGELEDALQRVPGRDMEHLITHARQFDLATLTADLLETNLLVAREAYTESRLVYGKVDYEMWRDYVLPYRVLEEDLTNWRPYLREQLLPVIKDAQTVQEAANLIHEWMHEPLEDGKPRMRFVATETRNQNPYQLLHTRNGGCKEKHLTYVCALRSVGIPARHCTVGWWTTSDWYHYFVQYYDPDIRDWRGIDASNPRGKDPIEWNQKHGSWHVMKAYAFPPYPSVKDIDGMQRWDLCTDITEYLCETGDLVVRFDRQGPFTVGLYTWNIGAWRLIGRSESQDGNPVLTKVGQTMKDRPLLVTVQAKDSEAMALARIDAGKETRLELFPVDTDIQFGGFKK